jgi:hypothetical protein
VPEPRDPSLDVLLDLDGQAFVVDPEGGYWVRSVVTRVPASAEKPHGLDYSLTRLEDFWTMVDTVLRERGVIP